jgi:hypothetical protein
LKLRQLMLLAGSALTLVACGGGGGGDGGSNIPPVIAPPVATFAIAGTLDNAAIAGLAALAPGQTVSVSMKSGQDLKLMSDKAVSWSAATNGAVLSVKSISSTVWNNVINAPTGTTTLTLVATAIADASKVATVTVVVAPQEFTRPLSKVGDVRSFSITETLLNGTLRTIPTSETVTAVAIDGSYTSNSLTGSSIYIRTRTSTADGSLLTTLGGAPGSVKCTATPAARYFEFPLFVGKTYTASHAYSCGPTGYSVNRSITATVVAYEEITVPAGTFKALKLNSVLTGTNATDLPGGNYKVNSTCYIDTVSGEELKCDNAYGYPIVGSPPIPGVSTTFANTSTVAMTFKN